MNEVPGSFFDRHPRLPILLLFLFPLLLEAPLRLLGFSNDPIWYFSGATTSRLWPHTTPFLDPNVGYTTQALGRLAAWDWVHGIVPWWNPYSGIGMPLAGELQPGAFFLPFNLLLLLPEGVLWLRIAMQILAGWTTYALLRELRLSRLASLMGAALYAVNGVFAWSPGPSAVYCCIPFLPLMLWGIERARKLHGGAASTLAIGVAVAWSILAGFPEPAYISGLLALIWGVYRLIYASDRIMLLRRTLGGWLLGMLLAAPLLLAFVDYLQQSDSFTVHKFGQAAEEWRYLVMFFMPYSFGPMGVAATEKIAGIWGGIGGYSTVVVLVMAFAGLRRGARFKGLKILLFAWVLASWGKTFGVQPFVAIFNHLPTLSHAAFFRYAPASWILALIILAAMSLDESREGIADARIAFGVPAALVLIGTVLGSWSFWNLTHVQQFRLFGLLALSIAWAFFAVLALWFAWRQRDPERRRLTIAVVLVADAAVMFLASYASLTHHQQVDESAIHFLQTNLGLSRFDSFGPIAPNYSAYFEIGNINHNVLPAPRLWANYVEAHLLPGVVKTYDGVVFSAGASGKTVETRRRMLSATLPLYAEIGTRYLITKPGQSPLPAGETSPHLRMVFTDSIMDIWELPQPAPYFQTVAGGPCQLTQNQREQVSASCDSPATLIRHELYMPGWQVAINRGVNEVVQQQSIFQAVSLPSGSSELEFRFIPPHMEWGWAACLLGFSGLGWQILRLARSTHARPERVDLDA